MINSIYEQPFWLDAITEVGVWQEAVIESGGEVVARLPYVYIERKGVRYIEMPPFTQTLGPFFKIKSEKNTKRLSKEKELIGKLLKQLPEFDSFKIRFHWSFKYWLPFYWHGFSQTTRYTYQIKDIRNLELVWDGFDQKIRTDIRKAEKIVSVTSNSNLREFHDLTLKTYKRQGIDCPYSFQNLSKLHSACSENNCSKIYFAKDDKGNIHAAIYIIWDHAVAYYLIGGGDPDYRNSGANSLLLWHAIQEMSKKVKIFDFEGSMIEPIERYFKGFGGVPVPYHEVTKINQRNTTKNILRKIKNNTLDSLKLSKKLFVKQ